MYEECGNAFAAEEEKQAGIQGKWQLESPAKEYLEQVKRRDDTYCTEK